MDRFLIKDLLAGLAPHGFKGDVSLLDDLVHQAQCLTREREVLAAWKKVPGSAVLLRRWFAHASKHQRHLTWRTQPRTLLVFADRCDRAPVVRLGEVEIMNEGMVLVFFCGEDVVAKRRMGWDGMGLSKMALTA